jgi:DNA repair ATPase RecN
LKTVRRERTITEVARLAGPEREQELARMISGAESSAAVMASAREMLDTRAATHGRKRK